MMLSAKDLLKFEEEVEQEFCDGKIKAPVHLSNGNEEQVIEVFKNVKEDDWVFSTWRSHFHALLHGVDPEFLKTKIRKGRSITLTSKDPKLVTSAIVGGVLPIAVGAAMGIKRKNGNNRVWIFVGDMTYELGIFHECFKYSTGHDLPITFVVEDNGLSTNTPTKETWGFEDGKNVHLIKYDYERGKYPHVGVGKWVEF